jgi:hypothetical protein
MRHTQFYRVSDCTTVDGTKTSVCFKQDKRDALMRFGYQNQHTAYSAVRRASEALHADIKANVSAHAWMPEPSWSDLVVTKALAVLRGSFQPEKAAALDAAAALVAAQAAENNQAWDAVA